MYSVDLYGRVRRACHVEGMSIREAARVFGLHRETVSKMLRFSVPPGYRRNGPLPCTIRSTAPMRSSIHDRISASPAATLGRAFGALPTWAIVSFEQPMPRRSNRSANGIFATYLRPGD